VVDGRLRTPAAIDCGAVRFEKFNALGNDYVIV
jgi:hypothetical protein